MAAFHGLSIDSEGESTVRFRGGSLFRQREGFCHGREAH
jgi:hypothetical protein